MNPSKYAPSVRRTLALGLVAGAWLTLSISPPEAQTTQTSATPVERPVSFAADQADRGEKKYASECEECHGKKLKGGLNGGAPLRGVVFEGKFAEGAPASVLFVFISSLMPPNKPGRFSEATYADLMAYVLKRNGFKEGAPLPSDLDALDNLIMTK